MSYFENFLNANKAYVDLHGTAHLPLKPKTKVAIVTCMDSRLHVAQALGLLLEHLSMTTQFQLFS
jgi:carbonic anhydrase